jgi:hypothetical protein
MGLKLRTPGHIPVGYLDGYDLDVTAVKGGEVGTIVGVVVGTDVAAFDADGSDGYVGVTVRRRPMVTRRLTSGNRPLGLIDEGNSPDYGTLFGSLLGDQVGRKSYGPGTSGPVIGPHTAAGSGKLTFWEKPGLYAVTLDAADTTASTGLTVTNTTLATGAALYATSLGLLTPNSGAAFETVVLGRFINFETNGSLVTTPVTVASAANSPVGLGQPQRAQFTEALFYFNPPAA